MKGETMDIQWNKDKTISIEPPKRTKKLTGTQFASVLGLNRWSTPFQMWCQCTKAYKPPFEETVYTAAGKAIEPKQIAYMREAYGMDDLVEPKDIWGEGFFNKTWGNFFSHPVFGGMWDSLLVADDWDGTPEGLGCSTEAVLEFKTTKRAEDWADGAVPEYYALQAALYAWLLNCDDVIMVVSFLQEADYDDPGAYVPGAANTATREFKLSERYPSFEADYIEPALAWWEAHVVSGQSPEYDERADKEYLDALRKVSLNPETDVEELMDELLAVQEELDAAHAGLAAKERRAKQLKDQLKKFAAKQIGDADACEFEHGRVKCKLTRTVTAKADERRMKADGIWEKYAVESESTRFTVSFAKIEEE